MSAGSEEKGGASSSVIQPFSTDNPTRDLEVRKSRRAFSYRRAIALTALSVASIVLAGLSVRNWISNAFHKGHLNALTVTLEDVNHQSEVINEETEKLNEMSSKLYWQEKALFVEFESRKAKIGDTEAVIRESKGILNELQKEEFVVVDQIQHFQVELSKSSADLTKIDCSNEEMRRISNNLTANLDQLKKENEELLREKQKVEAEHNAESVVSSILHSNILTTIDEYDLLKHWIGLGNSKVLIQKFKLKEENSNDLIENRNAILQEYKPIIILIKLSTGQRFGLAALSSLQSLRVINLSDNDSFMFSFDKRQKYSFTECSQHMKTTYIISFSQRTEIHIPDACFKDDHFFNVEEKVKFYKTKKHFKVEHIELYQLYDIL